MAKKKMGRPKIEINWDEFDKLCQLQCTLKEIAGWFDCSEDTIENRCKEVHGITFSDYFSKKSAKGKISLRRTQWKMAETNATMALWLGKQYLGQTDKNEERLSVDGEGSSGLTINFTNQKDD